MATIFKSSGVGGIRNTAAFGIMNDLIENYWVDTSQEKVFPISLWKLKQLFNAFSSAEVALKVTDISSSLLIDADWVAFDEGFEEVLTEHDQSFDHYFVFNESDFEDLRIGASDISANLTVVLGRIGKNVDEQGQAIFYAFFLCSFYDHKRAWWRRPRRQHRLQNPLTVTPFHLS